MGIPLILVKKLTIQDLLSTNIATSQALQHKVLLKRSGKVSCETRDFHWDGHVDFSPQMPQGTVLLSFTYFKKLPVWLWFHKTLHCSKWESLVWPSSLFFFLPQQQKPSHPEALHQMWGLCNNHYPLLVMLRVTHAAVNTEPTSARLFTSTTDGSKERSGCYSLCGEILCPA